MTPTPDPVVATTVYRHPGGTAPDTTTATTYRHPVDVYHTTTVR